MYRQLAYALVGLFLLASSTGCGGSLSPLYADFRIEEPARPSSIAEPSSALQDSASVAPIRQRIEEALLEAGWELDEAPSENAVSTKEVEIAEWGIYDVRVSLDVVPINQKFVRVYVHPYRQYFYGGRSKMGYMNRRVRSYVFPELAEAFAARDIVPVGAPEIEEDEERTDSPESQESVSPSRSFPD
jgi:hypothetical protein